MSSGKKRVVKQPVSLAGGAPSPASSVRSAAPSPSSSAAVKSTSPADPKPKTKSSTTSVAKPKAAQHPPVIVSSGPLVEPNPKPSALQVEDDFPPLPSKNGGSTPPTPKQSYSPSAASQPPLTPHRSLANQAADMLAANAQARANKTQQLSSMLNKVKSGNGSNGTSEKLPVVLQGEEAKQRARQPTILVSGQSPANTNAPTSPTDTHSPLDTSASFDVSSAARAGMRGADGRLLPSSSFSAYSPIAKQSITRDGDESELSIDMEDTADDNLHTTAVNKALSNSNSTPTSASSGSSLFNRSLNSTRIAQFANPSGADSNGLSESELHSIMAVANGSDTSGAVSKADYAALCRHLVRLQGAMKDREKDLRMAGELGEAVCVENTKLEANVEELTHSLDAVVDENARVKEEMAALQRAVEELTHNNQRLSSDQLAAQVDDEFDQSGPSGEGVRRKKGREDSASTALNEFIRSELSTNLLNTSLDASFDVSGSGASSPSSSGASTPTAGNKPIKYTGNMILDLTNLQRKLRRERRMRDRNLQALEQTVQLKERERAELLKERTRLDSELQDFRALQSQLLKKNSEWEEKEEILKDKEERIAHDTKMKLAAQRKTNEQELAAKEEELRQARQEHAAESKRRQQLEEKVNELSGRLSELNQLVERLTSEKQTAETARQQLEKKVASAERIVNEQQQQQREIEKGKTSEERRREEVERRAELAERSAQQKEQRKMELDLELQQTRDTLAEIKQQLSQEKENARKEREQRAAEESRLKQQLAKEKELRTSAEKEEHALKTKLAETVAAREAAAEEAAATLAAVRETAAREVAIREAVTQRQAAVISANAATMTTTHTADAGCQTTAPTPAAVSVPQSQAPEIVVTAESSAVLATPHAGARVKVSDNNQPTTVIGAPSALSPTSSSSPAAPMWVLPHPMFAVSPKDQELLRAMFSFLTHQWTMALLLLVSNSRVKKTVEWIKDKQSNECLSCHSEFGLFTRRHHCRLCGGLYCSDCSNQTVDLTKFRLDSVRVCTPCFQVVGVMTHGESLIVHRTKVNQKIKTGDKNKKTKAKAVDTSAVSAPVSAASSTASSATNTPRVSASPAPAARPPNVVAVLKPVSQVPDLQIVSGTPRLKKAKSIAAVSQPITAVASAQPVMAPAVRTSLDVTPRGSVHPAVVSAARVPAAAAPAPVTAFAASAASTTANLQPAVLGSVTQVSQITAVSDDGVQPVKKVIKKKVVKKVKRVVPVV